MQSITAHVECDSCRYDLYGLSDDQNVQSVDIQSMTLFASGKRERLERATGLRFTAWSCSC